MHEIITIIAKYFFIIPFFVLAYVSSKLKTPAKIRLLVFLVISAIITALLVKIANVNHFDPRPFVTDGVKPYFASATDNGFPSDHTTFTAYFAFAMYTVSKKWGMGLFVLAVIIGSARVIAGVHHAQDVIGGLVIAAIGYVITRLIVGRIYKKP